MDANDPILLTKNFVFDYKMDKEENKLNKNKNQESFNSKQDVPETVPKKLVLLTKTFDEDNKHQLSKSVPRTTNNSKPRNKTKHKRQVTQFKFKKEDNS